MRVHYCRATQDESMSVFIAVTELSFFTSNNCCAEFHRWDMYLCVLLNFFTRVLDREL